MPEALEINARSRDGIPIKVIDARVVFSISRGGRAPTVREPYPFTEQAVLAMVYKKPNRVMDVNSIFEQKSPSVWDAQTTTMKTLLREELSGFMGRHELGEYLASIGEPETEAIKKMAQDISTEKQKISGLETHPINPLSSTTSRKSRSELTRLFGDFNGNFNQEQIKRGVEAQWVGVGTWKMPAGIPEKVIPRKHITAWQITLDNMRRGSEQEFKELELNAHAEGIQRLILQAPINTFRETQNPGVNLNRARINLLTAFWQQLNEEIGIRERTGELVAPSIVVACFKLLLSISHIPYPDIPAPATAREKRAYADLLKRAKIPQAIEKLIDLERRFAPNANRAELLERITKAWDADLK
jgi:hypothetical protein